MLEQLPLMQADVPQAFLDRISPRDFLPIIVVTMALLTATIIALAVIVSGTWKRIRERQVAATLIQDMLDRNMSALEVQQLLSVWAATSGGEANLPQQVPSVEPKKRPPKVVA